MALAGVVVESDGMTGSAVGGKSDGAGRPQSSGPVGTDIGSDEEHCVFPGPLALLASVDSASTASWVVAVVSGSSFRGRLQFLFHFCL